MIATGEGAGRAGIGQPDPDHHLVRRSQGRPLAFTFSFRGVLFAGQAESTYDRSRLRLRADLGPLPYTAESSAKRTNALAIVGAASRALGGRMRLSPDQHILLLEELGFDIPLTPRDLMANTVRLVLEAKPYLDLLSLLVQPPEAKSILLSAPGRA
ncbi:MAG: hypothetical protein H7841_03670 [Magnetospirillum sp. WYHS-4]